MAREIAWLANILHVQSFRVLTIVYFVIVFVLSLVAEAFAVGKGYTRLAQMNRFRLKVVEFDCIDFMLSPSCCDREISPRENMEPWFNLVLDHTSRHQAADFIVSLARLGCVKCGTLVVSIFTASTCIHLCTLNCST